MKTDLSTDLASAAMTLKPRVRLQLGGEVALGPGKAQLLGLIGETGSISAAARQMGMSYRRAWLLVETMNRCFTSPLVETTQGGKGGGGAGVSELGLRVLALYQKMEADLALCDEMTELSDLVANTAPQR